MRGIPARRVLVGVLALALVLRTGTWWYPHTLLGVMEYDDGVYYAASKLLLHGALPYQDFTIVHPPVVSLLMLPAALLGQLFGDPVGMASARVLIEVVALGNVLLVYRLAHRLPGAAPLLAAFLYAVMPDAVVAEHTVLLEPLVNLGCLLSVLLVLHGSRRAVLGAGVLVAAACGVKLFAGVYVLGLLVWVLWPGSGRRHLVVPFLTGGALGTAVLIAPFALVDPQAFWHDVIITQLSRPQDATDYGADRVASMFGLADGTVVIALLLLAAVLVVTVRTRTREVWLWLGVVVLAALAFGTSSSYFPHYGAFLAPAFALLASRLTVSWQRGVVAAIAVVFLIGVGADVFQQQGQADLRDAGRMVPKGSCVYTDAVSLALAADVWRPTDDSCPEWIDGRGVALTQNTDWPGTHSFYPAGFVADSGWQHGNVAQMQHADFLLLRSPPASFPEWSATTRSYVLSHFTAVWVQHHGRQHSELWKRTTSG